MKLCRLAAVEWSPAVAAVAAFAAVGCTANVSAGGPSAGTAGESVDAEAAGTTTTMAVVVVERTGGTGDSTRAEAVARFVRVHGGTADDGALRSVGATLDLPATGTCAALTSLGDGARPNESRRIELANLGTVTLEVNGAPTALVARQFPDVADLVSGVFYARATDAEALPAGARYVVRATGAAGADARPLVGTVVAPAEITDLHIVGADAPAVPAGGGFELGWERGAADDLVYVDVASRVGGMGTSTPVRCVFHDSGSAAIPAAALGPLDEGMVTVHRLHREPLHWKGTDAGEVRFDFARSLTFTRR